MRLALLILALLIPSLARADELALEEGAELARQSVATVRILDAVPETDETTGKATRPRVTVCTGVCVEAGWIVTPAFAGSDSQIRLTLPGGKQSQGQLRVIDEYSGLALIATETHELKPVKFAAPPKVGAWVLSAAAWGVEQPVVSFGILSGHDRTAGGLQYPPLLQADLRATETSSGAALVNRGGDLLGVVVLVADGRDGRSGWTYAVPAAHVQRLLRARVAPLEAKAVKVEDKTTRPLDKSIVVLKRRRPVVGMRMEGIGEKIVIDRIEKGGPAEKAGLIEGDRVQAVDDIQVRSIYQASMPVLYKQPGDVVTYRIVRGAETKQIEVTLGGGVELPNAPLEVLGEYIRPKVDIEGLGGGRYTAKSGRAEVREVFGPGEAEDPRTAAEKLQSPAEQVKLLEKALDRYRAVIQYQQGQLQERDQDRKALEDRVKELERDLERLKPADAKAK